MNPALLHKRESIRDSMRALLDGAEGDLSAEHAEQFDRLKAEATALEQRIERETWLDKQDRRSTGYSLGDTRFDEQVDRYSLRKAIAVQAGLDVDGALEKEVSRELSTRLGVQARGILVPLRVFQRRAVTTGLPTGGPGSNVIPQDYRPEEYIDMLRARLVVARLGARVLTGLHGDLDIPALSVSGGAVWVAENAPLPTTDPEFLQVQLRPKHVGAIAEYSRNLLLQGSPDIELLLRDDQAKALAVAVDTAALGGTGTTQPLGIAGRITEVSGATGLTWALIVGAMADVEQANANVDAGAFVMHPTVKELAMTKVKVATTDSVMLMESPRELAGYPAEATNCCPAGSLFFGDWTQLLVAYWSVIDVLVNPYETTAYSKGNVLVRSMCTMDVNVRHAASFAGVNAIAS